MKYAMTIGEKIKTLREEKGLLQKELAEYINVKSAFMSKVENGTKQISKTHLQTLSQYLDCDYKELETLWLADRVYQLLKDEQHALEAIKVAESTITYGNNNT